MKLQPGEGETFVTRYRVALERRGFCRRSCRARRLHRPDVTAEWLAPFVAPFDRKILGALYLDHQNQLLGHAVAYVGTRSVLAAEPRGVFVQAILARADGVTVFQNSWPPLEYPAPSAEDVRRQFTFRKAGRLLGIPVRDYLVLRPRRAYPPQPATGLKAHQSGGEKLPRAFERQPALAMGGAIS